MPEEAGRQVYRAHHEYVAGKDELSLAVGDLIEVTDKSDPGWWIGKKIQTNETGWFPSNFVEPVVEDGDVPKPKNAPAPSSLVLARAEHDYEAQAPDELTLTKGAILTVLDKHNGWWKGDLNGSVGMFPANFVTIIGPDDSTPEGGDQPKAFKLAAYGVKQGGIGSLFAGGVPMLKKKSVGTKETPSSHPLTQEAAAIPKANLPFPADQPSPLPDRAPELPPATDEVVLRVVCNFDFKATNPDELDLTKGTLIDVFDTHADEGWYRGRTENGQVGLFPANFVSEVAIQAPALPPGRPKSVIASQAKQQLPLPQAEKNSPPVLATISNRPPVGSAKSGLENASADPSPDTGGRTQHSPHAGTAPPPLPGTSAPQLPPAGAAHPHSAPSPTPTAAPMRPPNLPPPPATAPPPLPGSPAPGKKIPPGAIPLMFGVPMPGMALRSVEPKHEPVPDAAVSPSRPAADTSDRPLHPGKEPEGAEQKRSHHVPRPSEPLRTPSPVMPLAGQPLPSARAGSVSPASETRARSPSPTKPDSPKNASPPPRENKSLTQTLDELTNELSALAPSFADTVVSPVPATNEEVNAQAKPQPVIPKTLGQPPKRRTPSPLKNEQLPREETPLVRSSGASPTSGPTSARSDESQPSSDIPQTSPVKNLMFPRKAGRSTPSPASPSPGSASPMREAELSPSAEYKNRQAELYSPAEQKKPPSPQKKSPTGVVEVRALPKSEVERAHASASVEGARSAEEVDAPGIKDKEGVGVSVVENAANGEAAKEKETSPTEELNEQNGDASEKSRTETEEKDPRLASPDKVAGENERSAPEGEAKGEAKGEPSKSDAESELTGVVATTSPSTNDVKRLSHLTKSRPGAPKNRRPISTCFADAASSNYPEEIEKKTIEEDGPRLSSDETRERPTPDEIPRGAGASPTPAAAPGKPKTFLGRFPTPLAIAGGVPPLLRSTSSGARASADVAALRAQPKSPPPPEQQQQQAVNAVKLISTSTPNLSEVEPGPSSSQAAPASAAAATPPVDGTSSSDFAAFRKEMEQKMTASRKEIEQKIAEERAARRKLEAEVRELRLLMQDEFKKLRRTLNVS